MNSKLFQYCLEIARVSHTSKLPLAECCCKQATVLCGRVGTPSGSRASRETMPDGLDFSVLFLCCSAYAYDLPATLPAHSMSSGIQCTSKLQNMVSMRSLMVGLPLPECFLCCLQLPCTGCQLCVFITASTTCHVYSLHTQLLFGNHDVHVRALWYCPPQPCDRMVSAVKTACTRFKIAFAQTCLSCRPDCIMPGLTDVCQLH